MAIERILAGMKVNIPRPTNAIPIPYPERVPNLNPACGPSPFVRAMATSWKAEQGGIYEAALTLEFIRAQFLTRGRPHFTLVHVALIDDAVAAATLTGVSGEKYGERRRIIEMGVAVGFHREAFPKGSLRGQPFGTVAVDGFRVRWQLLPHRDNVPILNRGVFQIAVLGLIGDEELPVASVEGMYMRRNATHPAVVH